MPVVLRDLFVNKNDFSIKYDLYYVSTENFKGFAAVPVNQDELSESSPLIKDFKTSSQYTGRRTNKKCIYGKTEEEVKEKMQKYCDWHEENVLKKELVILIRKQRHQFIRDDLQKQNKAEICFEFFVCQKIIVEGEAKYIVSPDFNLKVHTSDRHLYNAEKEFTIIPWTKEKEAACFKLLNQLLDVQNKIYDIMKEPKLIEHVLSNSTNLLTYKM